MSTSSSQKLLDVTGSNNTQNNSKIREIEDLIRQGANVNFKDANDGNNTLLHKAVITGDIQAVKLFTNKGGNVTSKNDQGKTPLDIALASNDPNMVAIVQILKPRLEVYEKLEQFVEDLVTFYEGYLSEGYERLINQEGKPGKWASFFCKILDCGRGGTEAIEVPGSKASVVIGLDILSNFITSAGIKYNRNELKKIVDQLYIFKENASEIRGRLVEASIEIFQCFEGQFVHVTADGSWRRAMTKLAHDAAGRILSYHKLSSEGTFSISSITKGIVLGQSKRYKHSSTGIPHFRHGHSLKNKNLESWNTAEVFEKVGIVTFKDDGSADTYYRRKNGKTEYGYRRLFAWECDDSVELAQRINSEYQVEFRGKPDKLVLEECEYSLNLDAKGRENVRDDLLKKIQELDPALMEDRLKEEIEQFRGEFLTTFKELEDFISKNFSSLCNYVDKRHNEILVSLRNLAIKEEEILKQNATYHGQSSMQRHELQTSLQQVKDKVCEIREIVGARKEVKRAIRFGVRQMLTSFSGRQDALNQLVNAIKTQENHLVVVTGLTGVGKSELMARHIHTNLENYDDLIWLDAGTPETLKSSFIKLSKKLEIPTRDRDGEEKILEVLIEDIYEAFTNRRTLFVFDNAENFKTTQEFLPPEITKKSPILVTSPNNSEWKSPRFSIKCLLLGDFDPVEATEFVKIQLGIKDDSQDEDISKLALKLNNFPLALQQAVTYILYTDEDLSARGKRFTVRDYLEEYEKLPKKLLDAEIIDEHMKTVFKTLDVAINKIKSCAEYGQRALDLLNVLSYFLPNNIPEKIFIKEFGEGEQEKMISITKLLKKYSIVELENGILSVHGLLQQVCRLTLSEDKILQEKTLGTALKILREQMMDRVNAESYIPHIISIWSYAKEYNSLIKEYIIDCVESAYTTYFHLIVGSNNFLASEIIDKVSKIYPNDLRKIVSRRDFDGGIPLHNAALFGNVNTIKLLLDKGANVNSRKKDGWTPLLLAANNNRVEAIEFLLDSDADVTTRTSHGNTPLHFAVKNRALNIVDALLEKHPDINAKTEDGYTPLHAAVENGRLDLMKKLLEANAEVDSRTRYNFTPLHLAAKKYNGNNGRQDPTDLKAAMCEFLLDKGAGVNAKTQKGYTPLHFATKANYLEVAEILLKREADVNILANDGNTALHLAAKLGHFHFVKRLIMARANVNLPDKYSFTPLHWASLENHWKIIEELLKCPTLDLNVKTTRGNTALHIAAEKGHLKTLKVLLEAHISLNTQNNEGKTAIALASNQDVIKFIKQHQLHMVTEEQNLKLFKKAKDNGAEKTGPLKTFKSSPRVKASSNIKNNQDKSSQILASDGENLVSIDGQQSHVAAEKSLKEVKTSINKDKTFLSLAGESNSDPQHKDQNAKLRFDKKMGTAGISGQLYEITLSTMFLLRGVLIPEVSEFYLATNLKEAGDFDDVVFAYTSSSEQLEGLKLIFLQAKHREKAKKEISLDILLADTDKGDFLLKKYFKSYREIKKQFFDKNNQDHTIFGNDFNNTQFIIYTNALFTFGQSEKENIEIISVTPENILNFTGNTLSCCKLKFGGNKEKKIIETLENSSDCNKLAKELADVVLNEKILDLNRPIFTKYHASLAEKVIDRKLATLKLSFMQGDVTPEDRFFRDAFLRELRKTTNIPLDSVEELSNKQLKLHEKFGQISENSSKLLPTDLVSVAEIEEFLDKLRIFPGGHNQRELQQIIENGVQSAYSVEEKDINLVFSEVQNRVQTWWKEEDVYLTKDDRLFEEAKRNFSKLHLTGLAILRKGQIQRLELNFRNDMLENLVGIIRKKSIVNLVVNKSTTLLTTAKVYEALTRMPEYHESSKYMFMTLDSVFDLEDKVIDAFAGAQSNLLIIESEGMERDVTKLCHGLFGIVKFNQSKKIVIISRRGDSLSEEFKKNFFNNEFYAEIQHQNITLSDLTAASQRKILRETQVVFQGEEVALEALIDESYKHVIDAEILSKIFNNEKIIIGKTPEDLEDIEHYYISRIFNHQVTLKNDFKESDDFSVVHEGNIGPNPRRDRDLVLISDVSSYFDNLCSNEAYKDLTIHWLKKENDIFTWQNSRGSLLNLRKMLCSETTRSNPCSIKDISDRIVVISDRPGMGKTTVLTKLVQETKESMANLWVTRINLNDHTKLLDNLSVCASESAAVDCLSDIAGLTTPLERHLFQHRIHEGNIVLVFDGFDEISPLYKEDVINLLGILKRTKVEKLWVTTRPHLRRELEDKFSVLSYTLETFSVDNQKEFLMKFWGRSMGVGEVNEERLRCYIEQILALVSRCIHDKEVAFTSIPLQTRMLAEAFEDHFKEFYNSGAVKPTLTKNIDLLFLYRCFVRKKYKIYCQEKKKQDITNVAINEDNDELYNAFVEDHKLLALYSLLTEDELKGVFSVGEMERLKRTVFQLKSTIKGTRRVGIVDAFVDGKPRFMHRTFAEYFCASWLVDNRERPEVKNLLRGRIFQREEGVLRNFFDRILVKEERNGKLELHIATLNNDEIKVKELLVNYNKCINNVDKGGRTALHLAAIYGYSSIIEILLCHDANFQIKDEIFNWTPLGSADKCHHWHCINLLLQKGANSHDLNEAFGDKDYLLHVAAEECYAALAKVLIEKGADVNARDQNGKTALHLAAEKGHLHLLELLVSESADINAASSIGNRYSTKTPLRWTALHWAVLRNHEGAVNFLLEKKAKSIKDSDGSTPLDIAVTNGYLNIVRTLGGSSEDLLKAAVASNNLDVVQELMKNTTLSESSEWSLLHIAAARRSFQVFRFLLREGAGIDSTGIFGSPLSAAAAEGSLDLVKMLVEGGADINMAGTDGWLPIHAAARGDGFNLHEVSEESCLEVLRYFLEELGAERGVDIDVSDKKGTTPLQTAVYHNRFETVQYLVRKGANINFVDKLGATMVFSASFNNNCQIMKFLIERGAKIIPDRALFGRLGITPLHLAAMYNALDVVKLLIKAGVCIDSGKGISITPLHLAALSDSRETIEYLIKYKADVDVPINFGLALEILEDELSNLKDNSMYEVIKRIHGNLKWFKYLSKVLNMTPYLTSKLFGHKNELLESCSNQSKWDKLRSWVIELIYIHYCLRYREGQISMLKSFINERKARNLFSLPQTFMLYIPESVQRENQKDYGWVNAIYCSKELMISIITIFLAYIFYIFYKS